MYTQKKKPPEGWDGDHGAAVMDEQVLGTRDPKLSGKSPHLLGDDEAEPAREEIGNVRHFQTLVGAKEETDISQAG